MAESDLPTLPDDLRGTLSKEEEIDYWRQQVLGKQIEVDESEENFEDFQSSSREFEEQLEEEIKQAESKTKEVHLQWERLKQQYDDVVHSSRERQKESVLHIHGLQKENEKVKADLAELQKKRQRLEQANDDLERRERELDASLADANERLDKLTEEGVWLQQELEEQKQTHQEVVQRCKEELRDQKHESTVRHHQVRMLKKLLQGQTPLPMPSNTLSKRRQSSGGRAILGQDDLATDLSWLVTSSGVGVTASTSLSPTTPGRSTSMPADENIVTSTPSAEFSPAALRSRSATSSTPSSSSTVTSAPTRRKKGANVNGRVENSPATKKNGKKKRKPKYPTLPARFSLISPGDSDSELLQACGDVMDAAAYAATDSSVRLAMSFTDGTADSGDDEEINDDSSSSDGDIFDDELATSIDPNTSRKRRNRPRAAGARDVDPLQMVDNMLELVQNLEKRLSGKKLFYSPSSSPTFPDGAGTIIGVNGGDNVMVKRTHRRQRSRSFNG